MQNGWIIIISAIVFVAIALLLDYGLTFYNRKCPTCGKRMIPDGPVKGHDGDLVGYIFHCPKCGHCEEVSYKKLMGQE